jgi:hypothetical protein
MVKFQPVRILTCSEDKEGVLVFANDALVGVLVRLSPALHEGSAAGRWFLEAAFPPRAANAPTFDTLESADRWFCHRLSARARRG